MDDDEDPYNFDLGDDAGMVADSDDDDDDDDDYVVPRRTTTKVLPSKEQRPEQPPTSSSILERAKAMLSKDKAPASRPRRELLSKPAVNDILAELSSEDDEDDDSSGRQVDSELASMTIDLHSERGTEQHASLEHKPIYATSPPDKTYRLDSQLAQSPMFTNPQAVPAPATHHDWGSANPLTATIKGQLSSSQRGNVRSINDLEDARARSPQDSESTFDFGGIRDSSFTSERFDSAVGERTALQAAATRALDVDSEPSAMPPGPPVSFDRTITSTTLSTDAVPRMGSVAEDVRQHVVGYDFNESVHGHNQDQSPGDKDSIGTLTGKSQTDEPNVLLFGDLALTTVRGCLRFTKIHFAQADALVDDDDDDYYSEEYEAPSPKSVVKLDATAADRFEGDEIEHRGATDEIVVWEHDAVDNRLTTPAPSTTLLAHANAPLNAEAKSLDGANKEYKRAQAKRQRAAREAARREVATEDHHLVQTNPTLRVAKRLDMPYYVEFTVRLSVSSAAKARQSVCRSPLELSTLACEKSSHRRCAPLQVNLSTHRWRRPLESAGLPSL